MTTRGFAVLSLAIAGLAEPVFACQGIVACTPSACVIAHRNAVRDSGWIGRAGGAQNVNFNSLNMTLLSNRTLAQIGGGADGSSLHAWVDPLTNREYALMGRSNGTAVVDVTNPTQPLYVANIPTTGSVTIWREPKVFQNRAFIGVDGGNHRLQIADLTQVRNYTGTTLTLAYTQYQGAGIPTITNVHTVGLNAQSGYLYLSGTGLNSGAPHIVNVNGTGAPTAAGNVPGSPIGTWDGYSHETQVVMYNGPDVAHQGKEIMVSSNGKQGGVDTLSVVNVTNKAAPNRLSSKTYAGAGYIHQGWFTADQRYFFQNDELESSAGYRTRTHLWDMQDLDNPVYRGFFQNTTPSIAHNLYVKGDFVYEANYTTGVRVLKIGNLQSTNPSDWLTEVAWFDTYMPHDNAVFAGAWNVYPYLPSGNILVSDIDGGLFVLRANLPQPPQPPGPLPLPKGGGWGTVPEPGSMMLVASVALLAVRRRAR